jgi:hypothetical protein
MYLPTSTARLYGSSNMNYKQGWYFTYKERLLQLVLLKSKHTVRGNNSETYFVNSTSFLEIKLLMLFITQVTVSQYLLHSSLISSEIRKLDLGKKYRRSCGKTKTDGETWLSGKPFQCNCPRKKKGI